MSGYFWITFEYSFSFQSSELHHPTNASWDPTRDLNLIEQIPEQSVIWRIHHFLHFFGSNRWPNWKKMHTLCLCKSYPARIWHRVLSSVVLYRCRYSRLISNVRLVFESVRLCFVSLFYGSTKMESTCHQLQIMISMKYLLSASFFTVSTSQAKTFTLNFWLHTLSGVDKSCQTSTQRLPLRSNYRPPLGWLWTFDKNAFWAMISFFFVNGKRNLLLNMPP